MSRLHDMGGRLGDGPVVPEAEDAPIFVKDWHARALAVTLAGGALGAWPIDKARHARESLPPSDYMRFSYYEKWIAALADLLVARGLVSRAELAGQESPKAREGAAPLKAATVAEALSRGSPALRDGAAPRFAIGETVRTRRPARNVLVSGGHTRLPGYAAGLTGRIERVHGAHVLPDAVAHDLGERPEPLYTVVFSAREIWGAAEHPDDRVSCELWESYLEPVA